MTGVVIKALSVMRLNALKPFKRFVGTAGAPARKRANGAQSFAQIHFRAPRSFAGGGARGPSQSLERLSCVERFRHIDEMAG